MNSLSTLQLLQKFAPYIYLHPDEEYFPCSVDWYCNRVQLLNSAGQVVRNPVGGAGSLYSAGQDSSFHLQITDQSTQNGQVPSGNSISAPVYGAVLDRGNSVLDVTYWFFYAFNGNIANLSRIRTLLAAALAGSLAYAIVPGVIVLVGFEAAALDYFMHVDGCAMHEGDWEHITVRISSANYQILDVFYAQHSGGQLFATAQDQNNTGNQDGYPLLPGTTRPIVYSAKSSHASYTTVDEFTRVGGIANDKTGKGKIWDSLGSIIDISNMPAGSWLDYPGRWGSAGNSIPSVLVEVGLEDMVEYVEGPDGPKQKGSWIYGDGNPPPASTIFSDAAGWNLPCYYSTIQFGDVDGCGQPELIGRGGTGVQIFEYIEDQGWSAKLAPLPWFTDATYWNNFPYYQSVRLADIDGDGQMEVMGVCGIGVQGWKWDRNGQQWSACASSGIFTAAQGWTPTCYYSTIQWADIDGCGQAEVLGRTAGGIFVYKFDKGSRKFNQLTFAPFFSDAAGWNLPSQYSTIQCADIDGCGAKELLGRDADGLQVYKFKDGSFQHHSTIGFFGNQNGFFLDPSQYSTIQSGYLKGPGAATILGRSASGLSVFSYSAEEGWVQVANIPWMSNANGWNLPQFYSTIQCADVDDDGFDEIVANGAGGIVIVKFDWSTQPAGYNGFNGPAWTGANGWGQPMYYKTIQCAAIGGTSFTRKSIFGRSNTGMCRYIFQTDVTVSPSSPA